MDEPIKAVTEQTPRLVDEAALILEAQKDIASFKPLYLQWATPIYKYIYFMVQSQVVAEDITSQVFLKACEQLPRYKHRGYFSAWLFAIARNATRDHLRKAARELPIETATQRDVDLNILAQVVHSDELQRLERLVRSLPANEQDLIHLRYAASLTFQEIGNITNRREDAVRKALKRLLSRLERQLEANNA
ncbi:MAG TPA: sigma-70 family RNA polymerase sigma factor [Anaerolineales bacterium]|nr:sigma-70 family RNA polymerase sigma factor [Anaerolineales bacterium]